MYKYLVDYYYEHQILVGLVNLSLNKLSDSQRHQLQIKIAELKNDVPSQIDHLVKQFTLHPHFDTYLQIKDLSPSDAWAAQRKQLIELAGERPEQLAKIYAAEHEIAKLWETIKKTGSCWMINNYAAHLKPDYYQQAIALYMECINQNVDQYGKRLYRDFIALCQQLYAFCGDQELFSNFLNQVQARYPHRSSLKAAINQLRATLLGKA